MINENLKSADPCLTGRAIIAFPDQRSTPGFFEAEAKSSSFVPRRKLLTHFVAGNPPFAGFLRCEILAETRSRAITSYSTVGFIKKREL